MTSFINAVPGAVAQGLIWGVMAIGLYITYKLLEVSDLTVDGSFCTGGAVCVVLFTNGVSLWVAMLAALLVGMLAGLIAPAIDDAEVKKGIRMDGTAYAVVNLFAKAASAVGGAIGLAVMGAMGYVANADQTAEALTGINIAANILPAVFCLAAIIPLIMYRLTPEKIAENNRILAERHAKEHASEAAE